MPLEDIPFRSILPKDVTELCVDVKEDSLFEVDWDEVEREICWYEDGEVELDEGLQWFKFHRDDGLEFLSQLQLWLASQREELNSFN